MSLGPTTRVLFLDDDHARHYAFREKMVAAYAARRQPDPNRSHEICPNISQAYTVAQAIHFLSANPAGQNGFDQVFLDHDLGINDLDPNHCGMAVVDHIVKMVAPPPAVVVHSMNYGAAIEMARRLSELKTIKVMRVPFDRLLTQMV